VRKKKNTMTFELVEKPISCTGCLLWTVAILVFCGVASAVFFLVYVRTGAPKDLLSASQIRSLHLSGTWKNTDGAEITFSDDPSGSSTGEGRVTFSNVPDFFTYGSGTPPRYGTGSWKPGSIMLSQTGLVITFKGSATQPNSPTTALLLAEGSPSSPTLICNARRATPGCTFTKV
jgi:hypothetical protein